MKLLKALLFVFVVVICLAFVGAANDLSSVTLPKISKTPSANEVIEGVKNAVQWLFTTGAGKASGDANITFIPFLAKEKETVQVTHILGGPGVGKDGKIWWVYVLAPDQWEIALGAITDGKAIAVKGSGCKLNNPEAKKETDIEYKVNEVGGCWLTRQQPNGNIWIRDPYVIGIDPE